MKITVNREQMLAAFSAVSPAVATRSPKPILQSVKLAARKLDGVGTVELQATNLELGIRCEVPDVQVIDPGESILPTSRIMTVLRSSPDESLTISDDGDKLHIRGDKSKWNFVSENPQYFPEIPDLEGDSYISVAPAALARAIRLTIFAPNVIDKTHNTAMGGLSFNLAPGNEDGKGYLELVGTDGRRMALADAEVEVVGSIDQAGKAAAVVPLPPLKILLRLLDGDDRPVHFKMTGEAIFFRTSRATIYSRLLEGRYPRVRETLESLPKPATWLHVMADDFRRAIDQAAVATSEESNGLAFSFGPDGGKIKAHSADVGDSDIEFPLDSQDGPPANITISPQYLTEMLAAVGAEPITIGIADALSPASFADNGSYRYYVSPIGPAK